MQSRRNVSGLAAALVLAAGIAAAPSFAPAAPTAVRSLAFGGLNRSYRVVHPADARPMAALVMVLHGGFGTAREAEAAYGWDALAERRGFVVVYPEGIGRSWNGGRCCGPARDRAIDDVGFLTAVIREVQTREGTDPRRIYATGISNGAIMAYRLACEGALPPAAIGPVAGALDVACTAPRGPVSVLAIHGSADRNVPLEGGIGPKSRDRVAHTSVRASLERWRTIDGCAAPITAQEGALTAERSACRAGTAVNLVVVEGAGHQWPGGQHPPPAAARLLGLDPPSGAMDATTALWTFFEAHPAPPGEAGEPTRGGGLLSLTR